MRPKYARNGTLGGVVAGFGSRTIRSTDSPPIRKTPAQRKQSAKLVGGGNAFKIHVVAAPVANPPNGLDSRDRAQDDRRRAEEGGEGDDDRRLSRERRTGDE